MISSKIFSTAVVVYVCVMSSLAVVLFYNPLSTRSTASQVHSLSNNLASLRTREDQNQGISDPLTRGNEHHPYSLVFDPQPNFPYFPRGPDKHTKALHGSELIKKNKLIMFYNKPAWINTAKCSEVRFRCPVPCTCSDDPGDLQRADAVIFHGVCLPEGVPQKRSNQVWIFLGNEPPNLYTGVYKLPQWRRVFNWKMTYRLDSDIAVPYFILTRAPESNKNYTAIALAKSKSAAWLVSHCDTQSKRENYVKMLQKHYPVDILGTCTPGGKVKGEKVDILKDYKFYLAFENSLCVDYVTEKYFYLFDRHTDVIPVVRGGANYRKLVPDGTYINTADFPSPKALAKYLHYLERNVTAYAAFLREKDKYKAEDSLYSGFCKICVRLHANENATYPSDVATWLNHKACREPNDLDE